MLPLRFEPRSFADPLFILYSSGTTGTEMHRHGIGGTLIQHAKEHVLHPISAATTAFISRPAVG